MSCIQHGHFKNKEIGLVIKGGQARACLCCECLSVGRHVNDKCHESAEYYVFTKNEMRARGSFLLEAVKFMLTLDLCQGVGLSNVELSA